MKVGVVVGAAAGVAAGAAAGAAVGAEAGAAAGGIVGVAVEVEVGVAVGVAVEVGHGVAVGLAAWAMVGVEVGQLRWSPWTCTDEEVDDATEGEEGNDAETVVTARRADGETPVGVAHGCWSGIGLIKSSDLNATPEGMPDDALSKSRGNQRWRVLK